MSTRRPKTKKAKPPLEAAVKRSVASYLKYRRDVIAWRQNNGAVTVPAAPGQKRRFFRFSEADGCADFTGAIMPWGVRLEIEVKRPQLGEQSDAQHVFEERMRNAGAVYLLVQSVEELSAKLDAAIADLRERFKARAEQAGAVADQLFGGPR